MLTVPSISFGDNVRVRSTPETESAGLAGLRGQVYGCTTPSQTGVEVVGELKNDYAVNVFFAASDEAYWLAPELLEFVDHAAGTEISLAGVAKKWVRTESGEWLESETGDPPQARRPWWQFWR